MVIPNSLILKIELISPETCYLRIIHFFVKLAENIITTFNLIRLFIQFLLKIKVIFIFFIVKLIRMVVRFRKNCAISTDILEHWLPYYLEVIRYRTT